jgi:hypothetical protein
MCFEAEDAMKKGWWGVLGMIVLVQGCWSPQDKPTALSPSLAPLAVGVAVYKEAQEIELNLEFVVSSRCTQVTPLNTYRMTLKRWDGAQNEELVDQYVSTRTKLVKHPRLIAGRYEIRVFHQDHPDRMVKKIFSIGEKNPLVLVDVPCMD